MIIPNALAVTFKNNLQLFAGAYRGTQSEIAEGQHGVPEEQCGELEGEVQFVAGCWQEKGKGEKKRG